MTHFISCVLLWNAPTSDGIAGKYMLLPRGEINPAKVASSMIAHFWLGLKTEYGVALVGSLEEDSIGLGAKTLSFGFGLPVLAWKWVMFCFCKDITHEPTGDSAPYKYM